MELLGESAENHTTRMRLTRDLPVMSPALYQLVYGDSRIAKTYVRRRRHFEALTLRRNSGAKDTKLSTKYPANVPGARGILKPQLTVLSYDRQSQMLTHWDNINIY